MRAESEELREGEWMDVMRSGHWWLLASTWPKNCQLPPRPARAGIFWGGQFGAFHSHFQASDEIGFAPQFLAYYLSRSL